MFNIKKLEKFQKNLIKTTKKLKFYKILAKN